MKLLSYIHKGKAGWGAMVDGGVVDLAKRFKKYETLRQALKAGALPALAKAVKGKKADIKISQIKYLPVIPDAKKIICIGLNYKAHREETGRPDTEHPTIFLRVADSQVGHNQAILRPPESEKLDWEGELAVIIGRAGRRIRRDQAMKHIAGYAVYNDGSVRDWQRHTTQFTPGKNFPMTGGFGPWMVTSDEIKDITAQTLTTRVNGVVKQQATVDMLIFDIPALIHYVSCFTTLKPGDVIVTGTPGGVGYARNPPEFLKPGDVCEIEITGVGVLKNTVKAG